MQLHIIRNNLTPKALQTIHQRIDEQDLILFITDGVLTLFAKSNERYLEPFINTQRLYVLKDDLKSRGLTISASTAKSINYSEFVDLTLQSSKSITW